VAQTARIQRDSLCFGRDALSRRFKNGKRRRLTACWRIRSISLIPQHLTITLYETTYDIVEKYENCSYVDYLADSDFSADDFYDGDHLNEQGARKLTKKLYSSLKTLSGDIDSSTNN